MSQKYKGWRCVQCNQKMHAKITPRAKADSLRIVGPERFRGLIHLCASCKTLHLEDGNGGLREMTAAEKFDLHMRQGKTMAAVEKMDFPDDGGNTLIIPAEL